MSENPTVSAKTKAVSGIFLKSAQIGQKVYAKGEKAELASGLAKNLQKSKIFKANS